MSRTQKLYERLDALERELEARLVEGLTAAADGHDGLFFHVKEFNPYPELRHRTCKEMEDLLSIAEETLSLRRQLGEPVRGCLASRLRWYCRKWSDLSDAHRGSTRSLARAFLLEIQGHADPGPAG